MFHGVIKVLAKIMIAIKIADTMSVIMIIVLMRNVIVSAACPGPAGD